MKKPIKRAETQYNDLLGTVALDFHGGSHVNLESYAEGLKIDTSRYSPVGLDFFIGDNNFFTLTFLCVDKQIKDVYMEKNNGKLPIIAFARQETLKSFLNNIKRFKVVVCEGSYFDDCEIIKTYNEENEEVE